MINDIVELTKEVHMHSLQHLSAVRVAVLVCESEDVQYMIKGCRKTIDEKKSVALLDDQWKKLRGEVKRKLNEVGMPDLIIDVALEVNLWPIIFEIFKWIVHHVEDTGIDGSSGFCWTPRVKIDYAKTAEILVKNEAIEVRKRFKLACFYCLDSEVRSLWKNLALAEKRSFFRRGNLNYSDQNPILLYWTYYIQEVPVKYWGSKILNYTHLFRYAAQNGYLSAAKFFFDKLKSNRNTLINYGLSVHLNDLYKPELKIKEQLDIVCFLFCQMSPNLDLYYSIQMCYYLIFLYFLEWPRQNHFLTVVNRVRQCTRYFSEVSFADMLDAIIEKDLKDFKDHDYKVLFIELWHQFPEYEIYVNTDLGVGFKILVKFVKKHFGFVFEDYCFEIKAKLRADAFRNAVAENETYFPKENIKFFKFLIRERVVVKSAIERLANYRYHEYYNLPLGELMHLIDGILKTGPIQL